jgi:hypothetical protein
MAEGAILCGEKGYPDLGRKNREILERPAMPGVFSLSGESALSGSVLPARAFPGTDSACAAHPRPGLCLCCVVGLKRVRLHLAKVAQA